MTKATDEPKTSEPPDTQTPSRGVGGKGYLYLLLILALLGVAILLVKAHKNAVVAGECTGCQLNLKLIGLALVNYKRQHGSFPPAFYCDKTGKPVNSWRLSVADLTFYHRNVSGGYDVTQPPNAPTNAQFRLADQIVKEFQCPSADNEGPAITNYVAVVGSNTMWTGREPVTPASDGSDNDKILIIEAVNSDIRWMEPRDLTFEQALDAIQPEKGIGIGSAHPSGINYVTVGGEVRTLDRNIDRRSLRRLLVRDQAARKTPIDHPNQRPESPVNGGH